MRSKRKPRERGGVSRASDGYTTGADSPYQADGTLQLSPPVSTIYSETSTLLFPDPSLYTGATLAWNAVCNLS